MYLEEVLRKYFGLEDDAFNKEGKFTDEGAMAYDLLSNLIYDLSLITNAFNPEMLISDLDKIEYEH